MANQNIANQIFVFVMEAAVQDVQVACRSVKLLTSNCTIHVVLEYFKIFRINNKNTTNNIWSNSCKLV